MAHDWIKMRTDLYRDPKVIQIAEILRAPESDLSKHVCHVTRCDMVVTANVTRNATVGALVAVWGTARHQGARDGDDLLLRSVTIHVLDSIADLPGFGVAMSEVGWVVETEKGLVFPMFFAEHNVDPAEEKRFKDAERQRKHRAKKRSEPVTRQSRDSHTEMSHQSRAEQSRAEEEETSSRRYRFDEEDMEIAQWMFDLIRVVQPGARKPAFDGWANSIRLMREQDGRAPPAIRDVFAWANSDSFWQSVCLSPNNLRKNFDAIDLKRRRPAGGGKSASQQTADEARQLLAEQSDESGSLF